MGLGKEDLSHVTVEPGPLQNEAALPVGQSRDEAALEALGYKQEFRRDFGALEVFGLSFSIFCVMPGVAVVLDYALPNGGPSSMVWGWAVASFFIMCVGLAMGELASAFPTSGGIFHWTFILSPPKIRRQLTWLVGYLATTSSVSSAASVNWATAEMIGVAVSISKDGTWSATPAQTFGMCAAITVIQSIICSFSTKLLARLQNVFVLINIGLLLGIFIALPIATPSSLTNSASYAFGEWKTLPELGSWTGGFSFLFGMLGPAWTICNFDCCTRLAEEATNASTAIPLAIWLSIAAAGFLGTVANVIVAAYMGKDIDAIYNNEYGNSLAAVLYNSFGKRATLGVWAIFILAQFALGLDFTLAASRQIWAFARDNGLPFSSWCRRVNPRFKVPINAVWYLAGLTIVLTSICCAYKMASEYAKSAIFAIAILSVYLSYSVPMIARFAFNNGAFTPGPFNLGRWGPPITFIAVAYMLVMTVVAMFPSFPLAGDPSAAADMNYAVCVLAIVFLITYGYWYMPKYGGKHTFNGIPGAHDDEPARAMH